MKKWFNKKFLQIENQMIDFWVDASLKLQNIDEMTIEDEFQEKINFNDMMSKIFEKYMQVALNEMAI